MKKKLSFKQKLFIDHTIGFVAVITVKCIARCLSVLLRRSHEVPENPRTIVVAKILGLGSIVHSSVLCRALKTRFPGTEIVYLTSSANKGLCQRLTGVDRVICVDDGSIRSLIVTSLKSIIDLWKCLPELYFDLEVYSSFSAVLATLSLARNRYGFYRKSVHFKKGLHSHLIFFNARRHISEIYSQMARCVQATVTVDSEPLFRVTDQDRSQCAQTLEAMGIDNSKLILVNPNASHLSKERKWPTENWAKLIASVAESFPGYSYLLVGSQDEKPDVCKLGAMLPESLQIHNTAGNFSLDAFFALVERCELMITNDSGPLHLAVGLNKSTVSLWGPGAPEHYTPRGGGSHEVVYGKTYCSPCLYHADLPPCEGNNVCMEKISVDEVLAATKRMLQGVSGKMSESPEKEGQASVNVTVCDYSDLAPLPFLGSVDQRH